MHSMHVRLEYLFSSLIVCVDLVVGFQFAIIVQLCSPSF
jgi:hypothetical protein